MSSLSRLLAGAGAALLLVPGPVFAQDKGKTLETADANMKSLLAEGYEIRSHAYYRCTDKPAHDDAVSCASVLLQKGPAFAVCKFDKMRLHFARGPVDVACSSFR